MAIHIRRREFIVTLGGAAAWPLAARAQQAEQIRRIAMLSGLTASDPEAQARLAAFHQGLKEVGWTADRTLHIDFRWSSGDTAETQTLARELVELNPELIVGMTTPAVAALVKETKTIPIVFAGIVDPIGRGFVSNMARPGVLHLLPGGGTPADMAELKKEETERWTKVIHETGIHQQ